MSTRTIAIILLLIVSIPLNVSILSSIHVPSSISINYRQAMAQNTNLSLTPSAIMPDFLTYHNSTYGITTISF